MRQTDLEHLSAADRHRKFAMIAAGLRNRRQVFAERLAGTPFRKSFAAWSSASCKPETLRHGKP
ncbi:MAG: hypothetical protein HY360_10255 [Verrucomicrobia bacterium]|nr:hypothetical protein [Verrucomicrobiota bacterium]